MFDGIYCKEKNSHEVYEAILIDEFSKCISSVTNSISLKPSSTMDCIGSTLNAEITLKNAKQWQTGMNVRAMYSFDGEFYEAIIEKILDDEFVVVRFLGYDNEEVINVKMLQPSLGEKVVKEQIKLFELDETSDDQEKNEECDGLWQEVHWKVGMACRALYEKNDTIYEATVIGLDATKRIASLEMTGYGVLFEAKFEDMYISIPEYRIKQQVSARKLGISPQEKSSINPLYIPGSKVQPVNHNYSSRTNFDPVANSTDPSKIFNKSNANNESRLENQLLVSFSPEGIIQPENESEALACLISANYLSGYYAGYLDCIRRPHELPKS